MNTQDHVFPGHQQEIAALVLQMSDFKTFPKLLPPALKLNSLHVCLKMLFGPAVFYWMREHFVHQCLWACL